MTGSNPLARCHIPLRYAAAAGTKDPWVGAPGDTISGTQGIFLKIPRSRYTAGAGSSKMITIYDDLTSSVNFRGIQIGTDWGFTESGGSGVTSGTFSSNWIADIISELDIRQKYLCLMLSWKEFTNTVTYGGSKVGYLLPDDLRTSHGSYVTCTPAGQPTATSANPSGKLRVTHAAHGLTAANNGQYLYASAWQQAGFSARPCMFTYVDASRYDLTEITYTDATHPGKPTITTSNLAHTLWDYAYATRSGTSISAYHLKLWDTTVMTRMKAYIDHLALRFNDDDTDGKQRLILVKCTESPPGTAVLASEQTTEAAWYAARNELYDYMYNAFSKCIVTPDINFSPAHVADFYTNRVDSGYRFGMDSSNQDWWSSINNTGGIMTYFEAGTRQGVNVVCCDEQGDDREELLDATRTVVDAAGTKATYEELWHRKIGGYGVTTPAIVPLDLSYTVIQREIASNDWAAYKAWMIANLPGDGHAGLVTTRPTYVFKDQP